MSTPIVRIPSGDPGLCCTCEDQSDPCTCSQEVCTLVCQSKGGTAAICGYNQFNPDTGSPKKYRTKSVFTTTPPEGAPADSDGLLITGPYADDTCTPSACGQNLNLKFDGFIPGIPFRVIASGTLTLVGTSGGTATYKASSLNATVDGSPVGARIAFDGGPVLFDGDTGDVTAGIEWTVDLEFDYVDWTIAATGCVNSAGCGATSDVWNNVFTYGPVTGACSATPSGTTLLSAQYIGVAPPCGFSDEDPLSPSQPAYLTGDDVTGAYGSNVTSTVVGDNGIDYDGVGCVERSGQWFSFSKTVHVVLSDEDTVDTAIARANAGQFWNFCVCTACTAFVTLRGIGEFSFGYQSVQVQAVAGTSEKPLTIGHMYEVTIGIYRRIVGSGGPFEFFGTLTNSFTADATIHDTPFMDIPNEEGWETKAQTCSVKDVTPP